MIDNYKIFALCLSKINNPVNHELVTELSKALNQIGYRLFVYNTNSDLHPDYVGIVGEAEASVFELINYHKVDAVAIFDDKLKDKLVVHQLIKRMRYAGKPIFIIDGEKYEGCINIQFDYKNGFAELVRHIVCFHGIKDIHFIAGIAGNYFSDARINIFKDVMKENGIEVTDDMISYGQFWSGPTQEAVKKLISENRLPKAFICANDSMAIAVCEILRKNGIRVPEDIAVTGFDGIDEINFCQPRITSSVCSYGSIGRKIAELLPECENNNLREGYYEVLPEAIIAQSCGCKTPFNINYADYISYVSNRFNRYQLEEHDLMKLSARIQVSESFAHAAERLKEEHKVIYDACILLNRAAIDSTINLLELPEDYTHFDKKMYLFYDAEKLTHEDQQNIFIEDIVPGLKDKLDSGFPLIFTTLNFSSTPLGYIVFTFYNYEIENYNKIPQTCNVLNNAIGGLHNLQYLRFLAGKVEQTYRLDALTGLNNRISLTKEFEALSQRVSGKNCITIIMADLDRLKYINDNFGHDAGDFALKAVADALKFASPDKSILARFGGDEMLGILPGTVDRSEIRNALDNYLNDINAKSGRPFEVSASLGVYTTEPGEEIVLDDLVKKTDRLMYNEKARKKAIFAEQQKKEGL